MRVATYNIASGCFAGYDSTSKRPERLEALKQAIREINADIIGLTDTFRWKGTFSPRQIQHTFGYPYVFHIDINDTRVDKRIGVALLSRHPLIASKSIRLDNRSAIHATIRTRSEALLEVFVVYLDDLSEDTRQKQVQALTPHIPNNKAAIVMGDFNALWPQHVDWVKKQVADFLATRPDFKKLDGYNLIQTTFDNLYQAEVLPILEECGLTESPQLRPTALTPLHPFGMPTIFPVDHILTKGCTLSDYFVPSNSILRMASDHYPLVATFK